MSMINVLAVIVNVIIVTGDYGLTLEEWQNVRQGTQEIFKREFRGQNVALKFRSPIYEEGSTTYTLANSSQAYINWHERLRREKKKGIYLVVLPPTTDRYITGYARVSCFKDFNLSTAVVFLQKQNNDGDSRLVHSAYVVAHELGHVLRATHVDTPTIMNTNPWPWITEYGALPFDIKSKREIKWCVNSKRQ